MPAFKTGMIPLQSQKQKKSIVSKLEKAVEKQLHLSVGTAVNFSIIVYFFI